MKLFGKPVLRRRLFSNKPETILEYTNNVINCDIHTRFRTRNKLKDLGAKCLAWMRF